jgi:DNA-directed RNA polymerase specialized sigma24 family protein
MHGPGKPRDEDRIKELLTSDELAGQDLGLEMLVTNYHRRITSLARAQWRWLTLEDVMDVAQATFEAVAEKVRAHKFKKSGSLDSYLGTIARNKAVNVLRQLDRISFGYDADVLSAKKPLSAKLEVQLERCYDMLPELQRRVVQADIALYLEGRGEWPTLDELTAEYNRRHDKPLRKKTIGRARRPGRAALYRIFREGL